MSKSKSVFFVFFVVFVSCNKMSELWSSLVQIFSRDYLSSNYFILLVFICLLYTFLIWEKNKLIQKTTMPPLNILENRSMKTTDEDSFICYGGIITHPSGFKHHCIIKTKKRDRTTRASRINRRRRDLKNIKSKIEEADDEQAMHTSTYEPSIDEIYEYLFEELDMQLATNREADQDTE